MLDDLSCIQSYNALVPSTPLEQQHKQWAANVGFIVTVGKPYYWQSSNIHVLPIENEPSLFSRALCMRTLPDRLTATIITRGFLFSGGELGGAGVDGYAASSKMRTCVM
jgi:hypothetical protein